MCHTENIAALPTEEEIINARNAIIEREAQLVEALTLLANARRRVADLGGKWDLTNPINDVLCNVQNPTSNVGDIETQAPEAVKEKASNEHFLALSDALREVKRIRRDILERKAWISPIRRLTFDVLSYIFEISGEDDWKTILSVSAVSKYWRDVVLVTPRAWQFPHLKYCVNPKTIMLFLERSGQRPLHVFLPPRTAYGKNRQFELISPFSHRLRCLSLDNFPLGSWKASFPNVRSLSLRRSSSWAEHPEISITTFPVLRHLVCMTSIRKHTDSGILHDFPPLESLSIVIGSHFEWLWILRNCEETLLSLKLELYHSFPTNPVFHFTLPKLTSLEIGHSIHSWSEHRPFKLDTPLLEAYVERRTPRMGTLVLHEDTTLIKYMRTDRPLHLLLTPALRVLQLENARDLSRVLSSLRWNDKLGSQLEAIEVKQDDLENEVEYIAGRVTEKLTDINRARPRPIQVVALGQFGDLPGMIPVHSCGPNMPCADL